jgi:F420-dependent oxidoreductase-like protein
MIEGQADVSWADWVALAEACEAHGVETLFRSDHYLSPIAGRPQQSLDAWTTIAALAARTRRLRLGTLVSPVTFRHPSHLAKTVATADHVSGGRIELGMGAGWMEEEHRAYGFPFPDLRTRVELLAEQVEIVVRQWTEERFSFDGKHYRLEDCPGLPKPVQKPRPPLLVGGSGKRGTVEPAVRWADEYNTLIASVADVRERRRRLDDACERIGRGPATLQLSLMTGIAIGRDRAEARERIRRLLERLGRDEDPDGFARERGERWIIGTVDDAVARLRELADAGVDRVMLQHLVHEDLETVELIGRELAPAVA